MRTCSVAVEATTAAAAAAAPATDTVRSSRSPWLSASSPSPSPSPSPSLCPVNGRKQSFQERQVFQTRFALILTLVTLSGFLLLSAFLGDHEAHMYEDSADVQEHERELQKEERWLNEENDGGGDEKKDYSIYSCDRLYKWTPDRGAAQCEFAKTCNLGEGIWMSWVFCTEGRFHLMVGLLSPFALIWLVVLFRLLGSTAEDYFSPALEMLAVKLGLPPRFAGVTLLALGNGAADVSATVSAITKDPKYGYLLSLGALTGAAMVISSVISAIVVLVAGGVHCRGALVRDVIALGIAVLIVWRHLGGGNASRIGVVGPETVTLFLSLYAVFVLTVLVADVYHRAVVLPRKVALKQQAERQRQLDEQVLHEQELSGTTNNNNSSNNAAGDASSASPQRQPPINNTLNSPLFSKALTAFSNYDNSDSPGAAEGWGGVDSEVLEEERPIVLHGAHGLLNTHPHHRPPHHPEYPSSEIDETGNDTAYAAMLSGDGIMLDEHGVLSQQQQQQHSHGLDTSWSEALMHSWHEILIHADDTWTDIAYNGDLDVVTKFLMILEVPYVACRKATIPIPCEGFYVRGLVALSMALSPVWVAFYMWSSHEHNVFVNGIFWAYWAILIFLAALFMRFSPKGGDEAADDLSLWIATPVALYGFAIAATWIDYIAGMLVSVLNFIGIVLLIPGPVVGLTILAWGNSMSDLSANITMARKGLANMAITACFAGPFFNILVGLGLGFSALAAQSGKAELQVEMMPSISTGFLFLAVNSAVMLLTGWMCGGNIPKKYGYIALTLYIIYIISSLIMEY